MTDRPSDARAGRDGYLLRSAVRLALGALTAATVLVGASGAAVATSSDSLDQTVEPDEQVGDEQVIIERGHVDIGPRILDGEWLLLARDDSTAPPVWRYPEDMVYQLGSTSILPAPDDAQFDFIDAEPGQDVMVIPQTEDVEVPWLGWNTQDPEVVDQLARGMTLRLHGVDGPGQFTLFLQSGNFDDAQLLWASDEPGPQDIWADTNTHVHGNWVFTEPGIYLLDVELFGELTDGTVGSSRDVLRFAVGEDTDPAAAFAATYSGSDNGGGDDGEDGPDAGEAGAGDAPEPGDPDTGQSDSSPSSQDEGSSLPLLALGIGALTVVLGVLIAASVLRSSRARRAAAREADAEAETDD